MVPDNAVWFITGCSTGIGAAIASHVVKKGHRLVATTRNNSTLSYLPDNQDILKLSLDVTSPSSIDAAVTAALNTFSRIDVIVNNAGQNSLGIAEAIPETTLRAIMEANFFGPVYLTRKAIGIFRDVNPSSGARGGTVVNVSSIGGRLALSGEAPYHASKFALEGWTEALASELYPEWNIRVMLLEPGGTKSKFVAQSVQSKGPGHEAYGDEGGAVNVMLRYLEALGEEGGDEGLVEAEKVAECLVDVLMGEELPLRLPTGRDAYAAIKTKETVKMEELERWKGVTESVG